jgi:hypothetical protein
VPSIDLRLAGNKSLVDAVTGQQLVTNTRASSGTFVDSAGTLQTAATNEPRFDHNPATGESLGLLVEEARTNLLLRSEEFDNAAWTKVGVTISGNSIASPSGAITADTLVEDTSTGTHRCLISATIANTTIYTVSAYAKAAGRTHVRLALGSGLAGELTANLSSGTVAASSGATNPTVQSVGNGWYRISFTLAASSSTSGQIQLQLIQGTSTTSYTGDGASGVYLWGAQLESGATPSSYIPTTTAAATRSADVADLISQAIANNIRTLYLEFRSPASGTRGVVSLNDNTANERVNVLTSGTDPRLVVVDGGVEQANVNGGTVTANQRTRVAVRINANDFAISVNGGAVVTDTSGTLPTVDRLMLGRTQAGEYLNGTLARVIGWDTAQPDLQSITQ